ncbi:MAG TPA: YraN family protein [Polyangiaceae bacterium]|nr:YraN family protein [Polyangiaceae bacterium]
MVPRPAPREDGAPRGERRGSRAEAAVAEYLAKKGLVLVATNLRLGKLELDVVAREGRVVVVVEVRERNAASWTSGFGSIDDKKRARVRRAAERLWQRRYKHDDSVDRLRIDAASVRFDSEGPSVEYVKAAF